MKRSVFVILLFLISIPFVSSANIPDAYNEPLSEYAKTNPSFIPDDAIFVCPGTYLAGTDIPVGDYRLDTDRYGCSIKFDYPGIKNAYNLYFGKNFGLTTISRLPIVDDSSITIEYNGVYFSRVDFQPIERIPFTLYPGLYFPGTDFPSGRYLMKNLDSFPSSISQHYIKWPQSSVFVGDLVNNSKFDLTDDTYLSVFDFPVVITEYKSPFFD